jgi:hypothetical protein
MRRKPLGAIGGAGSIEPHQLGVGRRIEPGFDLQREWPSGRAREHELRSASLKIGGRNRRAVKFGRNENELVAVESERDVLRACGVRPQRKRRHDAGRMTIQGNIQFDRVDEIIRDAVVDETNGLTDRCAHGRAPFRLMKNGFSRDAATADKRSRAARPDPLRSGRGKADRRRRRKRQSVPKQGIL